MPTTRKQPFTGRGAGAKQPSGTYRKPKGPEKAGPGLRELEQLKGMTLSKRKAMESVIDALSPEAAAKRKALAEEVAEKALNNPRPLPRRKKEIYAPYWNYRVVRRYSKHGHWLEVTEVHYSKGKPSVFPYGGNFLVAVTKDDLTNRSDPETLQELRAQLQQIQTAFDQPILDEKMDFGRVSESAR